MQRKTVNKVIVRVWPSSKSSSSPISYLSAGHAALEIFCEGQADYISFWPSCENSYYDASNKDDPNYGKEGFQCICREKANHFHTRNQDDLIYQKNPQEFSFYTLDLKKLKKEFVNLKHSSLTWSVFGGYLSTSNQTQAHCSSLVYYLLEQGGINRFLNKIAILNAGFSGWSIAGKRFGTLFAAPFGLFLTNIAVNRAQSLLPTAFFSNCYDEKIFGPIAPHLQKNGISNLIWMLTYFKVSSTKLGLFACVFAVMSAVGYLSTATLGAASTQFTITPKNIANLMEIAQRNEYKLINDNNFNTNEEYKDAIQPYKFSI